MKLKLDYKDYKYNLMSSYYEKLKMSITNNLYLTNDFFYSDINIKKKDFDAKYCSEFF